MPILQLIQIDFQVPNVVLLITIPLDFFFYVQHIKNAIWDPK